jgi:hypothetical protein
VTTLDLAAFGVPDLDTLTRVAGATIELQSAGTCEHPIRLIGGRDVIEKATGQLLDTQRDIRASMPCGNRRAARCAYCSTLYKYDAYNIVVYGLRGGQRTPDTVAANPRVFVTLTAPTFGRVHLGPDKQGNRRACNPRRDGSGCGRWHAPGDPLIGTPLDPEAYDYAGHVLFNALASKLWSATTKEIRRAFAQVLGIPRRKLSDHLKLEFAKVAEYQTRGVVHFHAVIRIDGPDGPGSSPPACATLDQLETAIRNAVTSTHVQVPDTRELGEHAVSWGAQLDIRPIAGDALGGELTDSTVARYVAKYATKGAEAAGSELPPLACRDCDATGYRVIEGCGPIPCGSCEATGRRYDLDAWRLREHHRILIETCWRLGVIAELAPLRLRQWAHMLGFGGHFATKSRTYSTTFGALRQERADYMAAHDPLATAFDESEDLIVINHWAFAGHDDGPPRTRSESSREEWSPDG